MNSFTRLPIATYRLQLNANFTFDAVREQLDYLFALGISDLYLSPIMHARSGSDHGYDVVDPTAVSPALGGREAFERLSKAAQTRGIGILLDIVPNHLAASHENRWWEAVVRDGARAHEAAIFDVFWDDEGKIVLPILADHYTEVLERDEFVVEQSNNDHYSLAYFEHRLPISSSAGSRTALHAWLEAPDADSRRVALDALLANQHYRLYYWRTGSRIVNYRRFFDINDLVALRVEDDPAFVLVHKPVQELVNAGYITGLRIDHVDGLRDPTDYLARLQAYLNPADEQGNVYMLVEKILMDGEDLPPTWGVSGTTGYDFLNIANGALTSADGLTVLIEITRQYAAEEVNLSELMYRSRHQVIEELFAAETSRLTRWLGRIARNDRHGRDLIDDELDAAIREVTVCLPVYRTYISNPDIGFEDSRLISQAVEEAIGRRPDLQVSITFLARVLLLTSADSMSNGDLRARLDFVTAWQQFTGPVMAKGLEDTTLYRDPTLLSVNTVGGDREIARVNVDDFHAWAERRAIAWPHAMNATSTHDSKRSEDVRARIAVLAEIPEEWEAVVQSLHSIAQAHVRSVEGQPTPDGRALLMLIQTLLGSWPLDETELPDFLERIRLYAIKAEREAKLRTSWIERNEAYEEALQRFIEDVFQNRQFLDVFRPFQQKIAFYGMLNSLSATLLKMTAPGIPDFYQGTEIWDFSLVDPDNRRPVDYGRRVALLANVASSTSPEQLLASWRTGAIKLYLIQKTLQERANFRALYEQGGYLSLHVEGAHDRHLIAFMREHGTDRAIVVVPRLTARLTQTRRSSAPTLPVGQDVWKDATIALPAGAPTVWTSVFGGGAIRTHESRLRVAETFETLPVTLLRSTFSD